MNRELAAARGALLACALAALMAARAEHIEYPAPDCDADTRTGCVARLIRFDFRQHVAQARLEPVGTAGAPLCVPRRYLEMWDATARAEAEDYCALDAGELEPIGRFFSCLVPSESQECRRPDIGVTLEGGGSKSAPFSLGVLAGLQRSGVLRRTDVIGSASGGTYAAYFYYARILDRLIDPAHAGSREDDWFRDCFPSIYGDLIPPRNELAHADTIRWCKESSGGEYKSLIAGNAFHAQVPYQYQAKVGQDLFAPWQTLRLRGTHWYDVDWLAAGGLVSSLAVIQAASVPAHLVAHALFDFHGNFSPTREFYRQGIERAYGHSTESWQRAIDAEPVLAPGRPSPPEYKDGTRFKRTWSLDDLAAHYRKARRECPPGHNCGFPLWILSTSSSPGRPRDFWIRAQPRDMQRFAYELGPHGHGSGLLGFLDEPPPRFSLRDAVGVSAAFLDDQQRALMSSPWLQFVASAGIFALNLNWGTNISNFNVGDDHRELYTYMPWPLYWLPRFQGLEAPYVRLSDGGNVDNLGLAALLRRGVRNIVISASTDDREGSFPSLCKIKNELELEIPRHEARSVYALHVPALERFAEVCNRVLDRQERVVWGDEGVTRLFCERLGEVPGSEACERAWSTRDSVLPTGYDLWHWRSPVVEGCVVRRAAADDGKTHASSCEDARASGREISRLLLIKPAIFQPAVKAQVKDGRIASCQWGNDDIAIGSPPGPEIPRGMNLPCVSLAFLHYAGDAEIECRTHGHAFPQNEFIQMTLNSSYTLFGAYYDLGRHLAGQIRACGPDLSSLCPAHPPAALVPACVPGRPS